MKGASDVEEMISGADHPGRLVHHVYFAGTLCKEIFAES